MDNALLDDALLFKARRTRISLTALIDVVFILLMFFMLTTSFTREKQLVLASPVASKKASATSPQQLVLSESGELSLFGAGGSLSDSGLKTAIDSSRPVVLLPAPEADVQTLVTAMTRLAALGMAQLSLGKPYPAIAATGKPANAP